MYSSSAGLLFNWANHPVAASAVVVTVLQWIHAKWNAATNREEPEQYANPHPNSAANWEISSTRTLVITVRAGQLNRMACVRSKNGLFHFNRSGLVCLDLHDSYCRLMDRLHHLWHHHLRLHAWLHHHRLLLHWLRVHRLLVHWLLAHHNWLAHWLLIHHDWLAHHWLLGVSRLHFRF